MGSAQNRRVARSETPPSSLQNLISKPLISFLAFSFHPFRDGGRETFGSTLGGLPNEDCVVVAGNE